MLKPSRFNYSISNDKNELLIINFYSGKMIKVSSSNMHYVSALLNKAHIADETPICVKMKVSGILIDDKEDEDIRLQNCYKDLQSNDVLHLIILTTGQCNFRCIYCPEGFNTGKMSIKTQDEIIHFIKENISMYTGLRIDWFGGEPLLALDVISRLSVELMNICKNAKVSYIASITTNAYLLTYNVFRQLLRYNVLTFQITIDGLKRSHDIQRKLVNNGPTYDTILHNLYEIKTKVKTGKFVVILRTNFVRSMIPDISEYFEWYNNNFGDDKRFKVFVKMVSDLGGERVHNIEDELIVHSKSEELFYNTILQSNIETFVMDNIDFYRKYGLVCTASKKNAYVIDSEGVIRKCACKLDDNKINKLGVIDDFNILNIKPCDRVAWNSFHLPAKCKDCYLAPACLGLSCQYANIVNGYTSCPVEKESLSYNLKIFDKQGLFQNID